MSVIDSTSISVNSWGTECVQLVDDTGDHSLDPLGDPRKRSARRHQVEVEAGSIHTISKAGSPRIQFPIL